MKNEDRKKKHGKNEMRKQKRKHKKSSWNVHELIR